MKVEGSSKGRPGKKRKRRALKLVLLFAIILAGLVVFVVPVLVSSQWCRQIVLAKVNSLVAGKVNFDELSMSWLKGIKVRGFSFRDNAGCALVEIEEVAVRPRYGSILRGKLSFSETIIDKPRVEINLGVRQAQKDGVPEGAAGGGGKGIVLPVEASSIVVRDGSLKVAGGSGGVIEVAGIKTRLAVSFGGEYPAGGERKSLANLAIRGESGFEEAQYMGFKFGATMLDIQMQDGLLQIGNFSSVVNNGQINFAGEADFRQEPTMLVRTGPMQIVRGVEITDEVTRRFLAYLNPIFANAVNIRGVLDFSCERFAIPVSGGSQDDIEITGTVSISQLRLEASGLLSQILSLAGVTKRGQDIVILPTRFVLQDGFLRYEDMQMVVGDNPVNFKGAVGLDGSLDMVVILPYTTRGRTVRVGEESEEARITLPLKGTIDKPELDTGRLLEEQLEEQLKGKLEEQLRKELMEEFDKLLKP